MLIVWHNVHWHNVAMGKKEEEELAQSQDHARRKHIHTFSDLFCRRIPKRTQSLPLTPYLCKHSSPLMLRVPAGQERLLEGWRREGHLPSQHHALQGQVRILD